MRGGKQGRKRQNPRTAPRDKSRGKGQEKETRGRDPRSSAPKKGERKNKLFGGSQTNETD